MRLQSANWQLNGPTCLYSKNLHGHFSCVDENPYIFYAEHVAMGNALSRKFVQKITRCADSQNHLVTFSITCNGLLMLAD